MAQIISGKLPSQSTSIAHIVKSDAQRRYIVAHSLPQTKHLVYESLISLIDHIAIYPYAFYPEDKRFDILHGSCCMCESDERMTIMFKGLRKSIQAILIVL